MRQSFKRKVAALLMAALVGAAAMPAMATEDATNTTAGQINSLEVAEAGYRDMIERYRIARDSGYYVEDINSIDFNYILGMTNPPTLYYSLIDLAQDGVPELFIGYTDFSGISVDLSGWREGDYEFYDIIGYDNGFVKRLFPLGMGYKVRYHLMDNGVILNTVNSGAFNTFMGYYKLGANSTAPYLDKFLEYDGWYGDQFFVGYGDYYDGDKKPISSSQWTQIFRSHTYARNLKWYSIDDTVSLHQAMRSFSIPVMINGSELACDQPAVLRNGRTLVPLRAIFEALGAEVEWNGATQTITAVKGSTNVQMHLNSKTMSKNGQSIALDVPPQAIGGRTMVPVRAIANAFDYNVYWDSANRVVEITD